MKSLIKKLLQMLKNPKEDQAYKVLYNAAYKDFIKQGQPEEAHKRAAQFAKETIEILKNNGISFK